MSEWIRVADSLPPPNRQILTWYSSGGYFSVDTHEYGSSWGDDAERNGIYPTHWMPLPEGPDE